MAAVEPRNDGARKVNTIMQVHTASTPVCVASFTEKAQRHKDGTVLLSIPDDRICKLNGVGALTWMILEENPAGLNLEDVVRELSDQFDAINGEGQLKYEVSSEQLNSDTEQFLSKLTQMKLLRKEADSSGQESYRIAEGVSGTTSSSVATIATGTSENTSGTSIQTEQRVSTTNEVRPFRRETFSAFIGLLAFDLLLKFRGFQSLIERVEHWPTAEPRTTDSETCRHVRAMVDRAQMYYPKKAMCLQHSAVVTCLLRRRGVPAEMVLAAQEFPPKAHAWVEVDGVVVNDFTAVQRVYRVMRRV
ncbi:MAG TPA: lasso peptide biosynthesis B2 protein [Pyrinomonadaceae bacterium]